MIELKIEVDFRDESDAIFSMDCFQEQLEYFTL